MSTESQAIEVHAQGSARLFVYVWLWLVGITGFEVFLAYERLHPALMLTILAGLSVIKAALIMSYFMHLKFERLSLVFWIVPAVVFCICLIIIFVMPDSVRLLNMRPH